MQATAAYAQTNVQVTVTASAEYALVRHPALTAATERVMPTKIMLPARQTASQLLFAGTIYAMMAKMIAALTAAATQDMTALTINACPLTNASGTQIAMTAINVRRISAQALP